MLSAGVGEVAVLVEECGDFLCAVPYGWLSDHVIQCRHAFQVVDFDDGGCFAGGEQRGSVVQQLDGVAVQPVPAVLGGGVGFVGARMRGGCLVIGEHFAEVKQSRHAAGRGVQFDDLVLYGVVAAAEFGGEQHDVAVIVHRVIMVEDVVGSQVEDLLEFAKPVHAHHVMGGRGEPHQTVVIEQQTVRTVVEDGNLAAQHAVRVVVEHEILFIGIIAEDCVQAVAEILAVIGGDGAFELNFLVAEFRGAFVCDGLCARAALGVGESQCDRVGDVGNEAEQLEFVGFAVLRFLLCVACEIRVSVCVHGIGDGDRVIGGEVDHQRRGVGAVRVLGREDAVLGGFRRCRSLRSRRPRTPRWREGSPSNGKDADGCVATGSASWSATSRIHLRAKQ